jgi:transcriptional regulator with XRE-family HTH domain
MTLREVLALNMRRLRAARGVSQEDLADAASIDRTYVSALERGVYAASVDVIERLAAALGVGGDELLARPAKKRRTG